MVLGAVVTLWSLKFKLYSAIFWQCFVCVDVNNTDNILTCMFWLNPINGCSYRHKIGLACTNHFAVHFQIYSTEPEGFKLTQHEAKVKIIKETSAVLSTALHILTRCSCGLNKYCSVKQEPSPPC